MPDHRATRRHPEQERGEHRGRHEDEGRRRPAGVRGSGARASRTTHGGDHDDPAGAQRARRPPGVDHGQPAGEQPEEEGCGGVRDAGRARPPPRGCAVRPPRRPARTRRRARSPGRPGATRTGVDEGRSLGPGGPPGAHRAHRASPRAAPPRDRAGRRSAGARVSGRRRSSGSAARCRGRRRGSRRPAGRWRRRAGRSRRRSGAGRRRRGCRRSCSRVRAPRITDVTAGRSCSQARATWAIGTPRPSATAADGVHDVPRALLRRCAARTPRRRARGFSPSRVAPLGRVSRVYLPVSQPPPRGDHGQQPEPGVEAGRDDLPLDLADEQVVLRLQGHRPGQAADVGDADRLGDLPTGEVRQPDVADLARRPRRRRGSAASPRPGSAGPRRAPGRGRRARRRAGAATPRAPSAGAGGTGRRRSGRSPSGSGPSSRARPARAASRVGREPPADDLLGHAARVDVRDVDEGAPGLDERVELGERARPRRSPRRRSWCRGRSVDTTQPLRPSVRYSMVSARCPRRGRGCSLMGGSHQQCAPSAMQAGHPRLVGWGHERATGHGDRDRVRRLRPGRPAANAMLLSSQVVNAYAAPLGSRAGPRPLGLRGRGPAARRPRLGARPRRTPTPASSPTPPTTRAWPTSSSATAPGCTSTTPTPSTPRPR